jgi:hypothetical protein
VGECSLRGVARTQAGAHTERGIIMHLYSRQGLFSGPFGELMEWATNITGHASTLIDSEIALWSAGFGAPTGTLGWSLPVDGLAGVAANNEKLMADATYHDMLDQGREWAVTGSVSDSLMQLVHGQLGEQRPPIGSVATITTATITGSWSDAIGWGVEVAQLVEEITGVPLYFGSSMFGQFYDVGWIAVNADAASADANMAKLIANADYVAKLDAASQLFDTAANRTFMTRVG